MQIADMREVWAGCRTGGWSAMKRHMRWKQKRSRVDYRSLEVQREAAKEPDDGLTADEPDRDPDLKLGPTTSANKKMIVAE